MKLFTFFARRYVAGDAWIDAVKAIRWMNAHGLYATCDMLGENVMKRSKAVKATNQYIHLLEQIDYRQLHADISVKLTQLGLDIGQDFCHENFIKIVKKAKSLGLFVWIDMESSAYTDRTLDLYADCAGKYGKFVGVCIQSYLRRSEDDVRRLLKLHPCIRLVKGAYKESKMLAFGKKSDTDANFRSLAEILLKGKTRLLMIATHDQKLIRFVLNHLKSGEWEEKRVEFGMLYGIRRDLQRKLSRQGHKVRIYTPFGRKWFPYFLRRLRERKENLFFALGSIFRR